MINIGMHHKVIYKGPQHDKEAFYKEFNRGHLRTDLYCNNYPN